MSYPNIVKLCYHELASVVASKLYVSSYYLSYPINPDNSNTLLFRNEIISRCDFDTFIFDSIHWHKANELLFFQLQSPQLRSFLYFVVIRYIFKRLRINTNSLHVHFIMPLFEFDSESWRGVYDGLLGDYVGKWIINMLATGRRFPSSMQMIITYACNLNIACGTKHLKF